MMKKILYIIAAGAMLLASCSKENSSPEVDGSQVRFSTEIATRASGTTWDTNDEIGIFMKMANQPLSGSNLADNVQYTTNGAGFTTTTPIYYPMSGNVDFVAYYPWRATPATDPYIYKVDVTTQTNPAAIDLLYSNNAVGKSKSKTAVALAFDHKLSRVVLNIKAGTGMTATELAGVTVKITGMPTTADFALADGTFSNEAGTATAIAPIVATTTSGYVATYTAIILPQEASTWSGRKMVFTVGGTDYDYAIPNTDDFATGKNHAYNISVNEKSVTVSRGTITDWTGTGNSENIGVEQLPQMVLIPAGTFLMGSPTTEPNRNIDETQHTVTLTKDFYMSKYTITNAQYTAFLNGYNAQNPGREITDTESQSKYNTTRDSDTTWFSLLPSPSSWAQIEYRTGKWQSKAGLGNHPFTNVSHHGALAFCEFYGYRLPTEAEWEYACRGDYANKATETATLPFGIGDGTKLYADMANFYGAFPYELPGGEISNFPGDINHPNTFLGKTQPVGSYTANNYGLYDMHGNVSEWCSDRYGNYDISKDTDPAGPDIGIFRVQRGGGWYNYAQNCRSAYRVNGNPNSRETGVGFRVVFVP